MRAVSREQRRATLVGRHRLAGDAADLEDVLRSLVALHATDPATPTLSVLARSRSASVDEVADAMRERRLVRWMAMRRTVFAVAVEDVPLVHAAIGVPLAGRLRGALVRRIERNGIDPPVDDDVARWLTRQEDRIERALARRGVASGAELRADVEALGSRIRARTRSETPQGLTSPLLTVMGAEGRIVRGAPAGAWTSRAAPWEPVGAWWPDGLPELDPAGARAELARRWLERFGPALPGDLQWWTGWSATLTRQALVALDLEEVELDGERGVDLEGADAPATAAPVACLLPALDPTPMGWKERAWFTAADPAPLYDAAGNLGPTVWWDGEIVGGWATTRDGVRVELLADRGREAADAVDAVAAELEQRLDGTVVVPAARTPLERRLTG